LGEWFITVVVSVFDIEPMLYILLKTLYKDSVKIVELSILMFDFMMTSGTLKENSTLFQ